MSEHTYSVKNVKTMRGNEGDAWEASLYQDGKRVGFAHYDGWGGEVSYAGVPQDVLDDLRALGALDYAAWCAEDGHEYNGDSLGLEDIIVEKLVSAYLEAQDIKREHARMVRQAKRDTLFVLEGENEAEGYRFVRGVPFSTRVVVHLGKKYRGLTIYNPALNVWEPFEAALKHAEGQEPPAR